MKKVILSVALFVISFGSISAQTIAEIVNKNITAVGGAEKLHAVKSVITESLVKMSGLEIENTTWVAVNQAMRSDSKIMGNLLVQAFDGNTAWGITPIIMGGSGEPLVTPDELAKSFTVLVDPFPLLDFEKKGTKIELIGTEKINEKTNYRLKVSPHHGAESDIWIDASTGLQTKMKTIQNGQEVVIAFLKYSEVNGVQFATTMETSNPMAGNISIENYKITVNEPINVAKFKMPIINN